jgi:formylglycine-generating enzyme required for sulfatase activity
MPGERPAHEVTVDGFWIDRYAITNADFTAFVTATGHVTFAARQMTRIAKAKKRVAYVVASDNANESAAMVNDIAGISCPMGEIAS